jgi:transposase-like protein
MTVFKFCNKCERERLPEGGVQTSQNRWLCAKCWTHFTQKKTRA